jgi:hypothetical protein
MIFARLFVLNGYGQNAPDKATQEKAPEKKEVRRWYDVINLRGYMQMRYNRLLETNPKLKCEQCDRSWGENGGIFIRRARLIFSGNVNKNIFFYIQPDFASSSGTSNHYFQIRDAYIDIGFDKKNEYRVRLGQSKVPFGFENMQSSQNRLPLDRADPLNSAVLNERDLGAFFYYAPEKTREFYSRMVNENFKGSGDYGVFAFGVYNGQTANRPELNNNLHVVSRLSIPIKIGNQYIEPGIQAHAGKIVLPAELRTPGVKSVKSFEFNDKRVAGTFVLYPRPFGVMMEYNIGEGPRYNPSKDSIETTNLSGGYATVYYRYQTKNKKMFFLPYTRIQAYDGGKKFEQDARSYRVREIEAGLEWQINKYLELTTAYVFSQREFEDSKLKDNDQEGRLLRVQVQLNF